MEKKPNLYLRKTAKKVLKKYHLKIKIIIKQDICQNLLYSIGQAII